MKSGHGKRVGGRKRERKTLIIFLSSSKASDESTDETESKVQSLISPLQMRDFPQQLLYSVCLLEVFLYLHTRVVKRA